MSVAAVIVAAGGSSRLGRPKQLLQFEGESLLRRTVRAAVDARCEPVVVVLGAAAELCQAEIAELPIRIVINDAWQTGMASSICCGIAALASLGNDVDGAILLVCDQPHVSAELLQELNEQRQPPAVTIVASRYTGTVGVPALFERAHFPELLRLSGDVGAKSLFAEHAQTLAIVEFPRGAVDIDSPEDAALDAPLPL